MKKLFYILLFVFLSGGIIFSQESDLEKWKNLPELEVPSGWRFKSGRNLPYKVDNFSTPYFRPLFNQHGWSCNQAGSIGYMFTYELNAKREVPGNVLENQYSPLFVWNFLNSGSAAVGVSYFDTWEIVKSLGCANFNDYPNWNNATKWMTGYDKYYRTMQNRIYENYSIDLSTPEGLEKLKSWLFDHNNQSKAGGVANFQIGSGAMDYRRIPNGTEEGGKRIIVSFSPVVGHTMTIVGYNDSIRYDYNNDGKYTNYSDNNGDGIINMADWEIGAVQFVNSWGEHETTYIMYRVLAEKLSKGGIWANKVHVVRVNAFYKPLLTMKVNLKHNSRNKLKITAGFATDTTATKPEYIHEFPTYNYCGGDRPMQGDRTVEHETIEIGLDITPMLAEIEPGTDIKYFLKIHERDSKDNGTGEVISFSVIDYQKGKNEIECSLKNYPIKDNSTTLMSVVKAVNFNKLEIETVSIPSALVMESFSYQMEADGGTPPYIWSLDIDYEEIQFDEDFPEINNEPIITNNGAITKEVSLDFSFPFYGEKFQKLYVKPNGVVAFYRGFGEYPYMIRSELLFTTRKHIKILGDDIEIFPGQDDNVKFEGDENSATITWNASVRNGSVFADVNIGMKIYPTGEIRFYYGKIDMDFIPWNNNWTAGFSNGDGTHIKRAKISNSDFIFEDYVVSFKPIKYPEDFEISESGLFTCVPKESEKIMNIKVLVTDSKNISASRMVSFSTLDWEEDAMLKQNRPNPFTNSTRIDFMLLKQGDVMIEILDMAGRKVKTLTNQNFLAGEYTVVWRAYGRNELPLRTGMYFCKLTFGETVQVKKMFLIR